MNQLSAFLDQEDSKDVKEKLIVQLLLERCSHLDPTPNTFILQSLQLYSLGLLTSVDFLKEMQLLPSEASITTLAAEARLSPTMPNLGRLNLSAYQQNFEEIAHLGQGGFGSVVKAKHKVDGVEYAVKKIQFRHKGFSSVLYDNVMREVTCLARLDNSNICRYHSAWIEPKWTNTANPPVHHRNPRAVKKKGFNIKKSMSMDVFLKNSAENTFESWGSSDLQTIKEKSGEMPSFGGGRPELSFDLSESESERKSPSWSPVNAPVLSDFSSKNAAFRVDGPLCLNGNGSGVRISSASATEDESITPKSISSSASITPKNGLRREQRTLRMSLNTLNAVDSFDSQTKALSPMALLGNQQSTGSTAFPFIFTPQNTPNSPNPSLHEESSQYLTSDSDNDDDDSSFCADHSNSLTSQSSNSDSDSDSSNSGSDMCSDDDDDDDIVDEDDDDMNFEFNSQDLSLRGSMGSATSCGFDFGDPEQRSITRTVSTASKLNIGATDDETNPIKIDEASTSELSPQDMLLMVPRSRSHDDVYVLGSRRPNNSPNAGAGGADAAIMFDNQMGYDLVLYIQLTLYPNGTLEQWLQHRDRVLWNRGRPTPRQSTGTVPVPYNDSRGLCAFSNVQFPLREEVLPHCWLKIFIGVLKGLLYIHNNNIIHRDVKPANIFFDDDCKVRIGDFGLAKYLEENGSEIETQGNSGSSHTTGLGTHSYAAPEQIAHHEYSISADMYSIGIILFEMCNPFSSGMDRARTITDLRHNPPILPTEFKHRFPNISPIIIALLSHNHTQRPTCSEVLKDCKIFKNGAKEHHMKTVIEDQQKKIDELERKLNEMNKEKEKCLKFQTCDDASYEI
eukprot:TRINITY_DN1218_c0_g2_i1.p1 TRINITY_DN1218_c0_g2~~TRINITY_DN1218_c0_g2_i1.p1  ORF type:complete len:847 (+),score=230.13 TRINITY_DN1218_c0_g2_i1:153-2693(+)